MQPLLLLESAKQDFKISCDEAGSLPRGFHDGLKTRRLNRWERTTLASAACVEPFPDHFLSTLPDDVANALALRLRLAETTAILTGEEPLPLVRSECRSPSPPATYDEQGKRNNTREQRKRLALARERQYLVDDATKLHPKFKPPADFKPVALKKTCKLYIPEREHPTYNFIGIILGPRGSTQKELEMQTGAKISIRGRGSTKDGRGVRGRTEADDDDLHVLITADTDAQMAAAVKRVQQLLVPVDEGQNEHKRKQLRKLAEYNGTLTNRERSADLIRQQLREGHHSLVRCSMCGETSHPTIDCPSAASAAQQHAVGQDDEKLAAAYAECMAAMQHFEDAPTAAAVLPPPAATIRSSQTYSYSPAPTSQEPTDELPPWLQQ